MLHLQHRSHLLWNGGVCVPTRLRSCIAMDAKPAVSTSTSHGNYDADVVVIGGGSAGVRTARTAADLGESLQGPNWLMLRCACGALPLEVKLTGIYRYLALLSHLLPHYHKYQGDATQQYTRNKR